MLQNLLQVNQHIQGRNLLQVHDGVAVQHLIIEAQVIEAHHQIRPHQLLDEIIDLFFLIDAVITTGRAVSHADAHPHIADIVPAADLIGGFLRFQVKVNDVLHGSFVTHTT